MTTVCPARTPPARTADPQPVGTPQATSAATSKPISSGILITENSCTTAYCEKVPSTHRPPKSSPFWWNRNVPSGNIPVPAFLPASQRFWRPVEQYRHWPQAGMNEQVTWSPTLTRVTASPTASTTPAPSWPPTTGSRIGASPFWMWSSEWQRPAAKNLILTSLAFGSSSSSSVISHGWPGTRQTAARVVMLTGAPLSHDIADDGRRAVCLIMGHPAEGRHPPVFQITAGNLGIHRFNSDRRRGNADVCQGQRSGV